ncbi:MAG: TIGR04551 family protein [Polyangiaceae bacterium]
MRTLPWLLPAFVLLVAFDAVAQPAAPGSPEADEAPLMPKAPSGDGAAADSDKGPSAPQAKTQPGDAEPPKGGDPKADPAKDPPKDPATTAAPAQPAPEASKPAKGDGTEGETRVFAEDWWTSARPVFEIHGYYRVRSEFFSHFALGRKDSSANALWPQPADNDYIDSSGVRNRVILCGDDPSNPQPCENNVQAGANMRFRINPELHISDNLRVLAQLDLLDNVVLGSTPEGYVNYPGDSGGYQVRQRGGYTPIGAFSSTQWAPTSGENSLQDSITVKRVWGEYLTPIGQVRFGRMPSNWGLGMLVNSGEGYDSDYASTADRIMFSTGIKSIDLYFAGLWDFANEGATSSIIGERQGQPYDLIQSDDVSQWGIVIIRKRQDALAKLELAKGLPVINGGVYGVYRQQTLEAQTALGATSNQVTAALVRRNAWAVIPDFWFQFLWGKFRFEAEAAVLYGHIENTDVRGGNNFDSGDPDNPGWKIFQFGIASQAEIRAFDDRLRVQLGFGYATGDDDVEGLAPPAEGFDAQLTKNRTFSTFRFHPDYRVDLILWRNILQRVQGAYYFRPTVEYDFTRDLNGQRIGGGATLIWSRASQPVQAPGNASDLGLELNFKLYYQARDGSLNDDLERVGGFYTQLEYGVLFPLGGLEYLSGEKQDFEDAGNPVDTATAQTVRWYLGILY